MLTSKQRAALKAKANGCEAVFQIGKGVVSDTLAAAVASSAARAGSPGQMSPQVSTKICPPICSAAVFPFSSMLPERGAFTPRRRFIYARCSVETSSPPHQNIPMPRRV